MISIVVPVYNGEQFIIKTVESVIAQTYKDWELILVDNGSTDKTLELLSGISDKRVRVLTCSKKGACHARNAGVDAANGRYIAYLDADDLWDKHKLDKTFSYMIKKNAGFVFTGYEFGDEQGNPTGKIVRVPEKLDYRHALSRTVIFTSTVLFDTEKIPASLIHMPEIESEDTATWWNILRNGHIAYGLNENLVVYRRSTGTLSSNKLVAIRRIWNLYRKNEKLGIVKSAVSFVGWAFGAVVRRI